MGVRCSCGVIVDASKANVNFTFVGIPGSVSGTVLYFADVCRDTLSTSTLSLSFVNNNANGPSFVLTVSPTIPGTSICSVTCRLDGDTCVVTVTGTGLKTGFDGTELVGFTVVFRDGPAEDKVQSFDIPGFSAQTQAETIPNGSIKALGCIS